MTDHDDKGQVRPLRARVMTLHELQLKTLDLIRKTRFQFNRSAHEDGMSDGEFMSQIVDPLEHQIVNDRWMIEQQKKKSREQGT